MDSHWNLQPPVSEPSIVEYNRSLSVPQSTSFNNSQMYSQNQQQSSRYNGYFDSSVPYQAPKSAPPSYPLTSPISPGYSQNSFFGGPTSNPSANVTNSYGNSSSNSYNGSGAASSNTISKYDYPNQPSRPSVNTMNNYGNSTPSNCYNGSASSSVPYKYDYSNSANSQGNSTTQNAQAQDGAFSQQSRYYGGTTNSTSPPSQYTPPVADFKIGTFTLNPSGYPTEGNGNESNSSNNFSSNGTSQSNGGSQSSSANNQSVRETGIIEKLLQTYGFIQCCERQARLFFHFSQFDGNTEHLRIGDPVEFEVTFDRRTGKPIASTVTKISPEVVLSEERVVGCVTTEPRVDSTGSHQGRITYENRGECFFLPYCKEDVEGYVTLKPTNKVSFQIATNQRSGNLTARHIRLENPGEPVKYKGVVSAIKDSYGFIERADVVDEIFFHFSESKTIPGGLKLGDDVEFLIQSRNAKEVATNMIKLPPGTVIFEDIDREEMRGQVLKSVEKTLRANQKDPLTGRIRYRGKDRSEIEVKFGERDQKGDFTLRHGDWVKFNVATDRRDHLQKATNISLLDESFNVSGEKREQGVISSLKDGYGFIRCCEREAKVYFLYTEILDPQKEICLGEEVELTVITDQVAQSTSRQVAIRIRRLAKGSVQFEVLLKEGMQGEVSVEPVALPLVTTDADMGPDMAYQPGIIQFKIDGFKQTINFYPVEGEEEPKVGNRVEFNVYLRKCTKEHIARNIKVVCPIITSVSPNAMSSRHTMIGSGRTFDRGSTGTSTIGPPGVLRRADSPDPTDALYNDICSSMGYFAKVDTKPMVEKLDNLNENSHMMGENGINHLASKPSNITPSLNNMTMNYSQNSSPPQNVPEKRNQYFDQFYQASNNGNPKEAPLNLGTLNQGMAPPYQNKPSRISAFFDVKNEVLENHDKGNNMLGESNFDNMLTDQTFGKVSKNSTYSNVSMGTNFDNMSRDPTFCNNVSRNSSFAGNVSSFGEALKEPTLPTMALVRDQSYEKVRRQNVNARNEATFGIESRESSFGNLSTKANVNILNSDAGVGNREKGKWDKEFMAKYIHIDEDTSDLSQEVVDEINAKFDPKFMYSGEQTLVEYPLMKSIADDPEPYPKTTVQPGNYSDVLPLTTRQRTPETETVKELPTFFEPYSNSPPSDSGIVNDDSSDSQSPSVRSVSPQSENDITPVKQTVHTGRNVPQQSTIIKTVSSLDGPLFGSSRSSALPIHEGYIAALKENFGFIETSNHDKEIFFHFSNVDGNTNNLDLGNEVEYTISSRTGPGGKLSAENVRILPLGSLPQSKILGDLYEGTVMRSMRSVNPEQSEYCGLVCVGKEDEKLSRHMFGITGLVNKRELLQPSDQVTFQLDENGWAVNIRAVRKKLLAIVEAVKGQYGFLTYENEEGKKLFFHQSEVKDNITLTPGDEVQFVIITNHKSGKSAACNITRLTTASGPSQRPSRLVSKLKHLSTDGGSKRILVVRQPRGPDGTKGFKSSK